MRLMADISGPMTGSFAAGGLLRPQRAFGFSLWAQSDGCLISDVNFTLLLSLSGFFLLRSVLFSLPCSSPLNLPGVAVERFVPFQRCVTGAPDFPC